ncbi:MAG: TAXI family TRAP transporter solute-binding subunit [Cryobacterium sp.]|nr:TAXI family TRAP transporter solute-binding subunit [Cryobacterium sp.]
MRAAAALAIGVVSVLGLGGCSSITYEQEYVIAGGGTAGVYYNYGAHLAEELSHALDTSVIVEESGGSVDNLLRIGRGQAVMGFAQGDAAADAIAGTGMFTSPVPILAVARLYDEYVHVVVRGDSDIEEIADLEGRVVSLGASGSGVNVVATRVLHAVGLSSDSVVDRELGLDASIEALARGDIEGFFWVGGLPTPGVERVSAELPIRLLSIQGETVNSINALHKGVYRLADFPTGAYNRAGTTSTMTVPNYLFVAEDASPDFVREVTRVLFDSRSEIGQAVPAANLLDLRQAIFTDPIDLHPGAIEYYSERRG